MARQVIQLIRYTDDLTGAEVAEDDVRSVTFAVDGTTYEIDLSPDTAAQFEEVLAPFVTAARRITDARGRTLAAGKEPKRRRTRAETHLIREWGRANGMEVPSHGRTPEKLIAAYDAAHGRD